MAKRAIASGDPRETVCFRCKACKHVWKEAPPKIVDYPERMEHPWRYFADCPECGHLDCEQAHWEQAMLISAYHGSGGPKTPEGKRRVSLNAVLNPPSPEAAARTKFNAFKHGRYAKQAMFYPAKPGSYPHCVGCQWLHNGCGEWDHGACLTRTELYLQHVAAYQTRDRALLTDLGAQRFAHTQVVISEILLKLATGGVEIRRPHYVQDKDGNIHLVEYLDAEGNLRRIEDVLAHPLLKHLTDLLGKNSEIMHREGLTEQAQEEEEQLRGFVARDQQQQIALADHAEKQTQSLTKLLDLVERSRERTKRDPVLIEHQREEG